MFIPLKDLNPRRTYPFVNTALILAQTGANVLVLRPARARPTFSGRVDGNTAGGAVTFVFAGDPARLPSIARFRYELP